MKPLTKSVMKNNTLLMGYFTVISSIFMVGLISIGIGYFQSLYFSAFGGGVASILLSKYLDWIDERN